jgi:hypothetical protein
VGWKRSDRFFPRFFRPKPLASLLEEDQAFKAWYRNVLRGSYNTAATYLLRMGKRKKECRQGAQTTISSVSSSVARWTISRLPLKPVTMAAGLTSTSQIIRFRGLCDKIPSSFLNSKQKC